MSERIRNFAYATLSLALLGFAASNWITTAGELRRFYTNMWIWDPWDYLSHFDQYRHFDLGVFWIQHNEHREIGTELSYVLDLFVFQGRQLVPEIAGIAAYLGVLAVFMSCLWFTARGWPSLAAALLAMAIAGYKLCVVSLTIPFLTSWPQWEFFGSASLAFIVLRQTRGSIFLLAAICSAVAATYSMSNGMLVWPLLALSAFLLRFRGRDISAIVLAGTASIALYFFQYRDMHSLALATALQNPGYFGMFLGTFLGMPFSAAYHASIPIIRTSICGWAGLALAVLDLGWIVHKKLLAAPAVVVLGGFCALATASSILTAFGRMNASDPLIVAAQAGRYITEPTLFWCALVMLTTWLFGGYWNGYAGFLFLAAGGMAAVLILPKSTEYYAGWEKYFQRGQWAAIAFANGVTDDSVAEVLFPGPAYVAQFKHVLIENRLAVFADPEPGWIGRQAGRTFAHGSDGYLHGSVTTVRKLGHDYEVQGWAEGVSRVVFVAETGQIVGFGMRPPAGPADLYSQDVPRSLAFTGFIRGECKAREFSLWAVDRKGTKIARMGPLRSLLPQ